MVSSIRENLIYVFFTVILLSVYMYSPQVMILENVLMSENSPLFSYDVNLIVIPFVMFAHYLASKTIQYNKIKFKDYSIVVFYSLFYIIALANVAMFINYVDVSIINTEWSTFLTWCFANFFITDLTEEIIFRLWLPFVILISLTQQYSFDKRLMYALIVSSFIFGLMHFNGGIALIGLATISGLFYSFIYYKFRNILYAISAHFFVNLFHILLFTYPHK